MYGILVGWLAEMALGGLGGLLVPGQFPWGFGLDGLWSGLQAFSLFGLLGCGERSEASAGRRPAPFFWRGAGKDRVDAAEFRAGLPVPYMGRMMGCLM